MCWEAQCPWLDINLWTLTPKAVLFGRPGSRCRGQSRRRRGAVPRGSLSLPWLLPSGPKTPLAFIEQFLFLV